VIFYKKQPKNLHKWFLISSLQFSMAHSFNLYTWET